MKELTFDYVKPELWDFNTLSAQGDDGSCFIDCTSDDICPDDDEI